MLLPVLLYVVLVLTTQKIIIKKWLGYQDVYAFRIDCLEDENFYPISVFGLGLFCVVVVLPVTLVLLPFAFYWLVFKIWQTIYLRFLKHYMC